MNLARSQPSPAHVRAFLKRHHTGLITLLFTDIVGSVLLKQRLGDAEGVRQVQQHHALLREILRQFPEGQEINTAGDSFLLMFTTPSEAVKYALLVQSRLRAEAATADYPIQDRIGIHVGEVFIAERSPGGSRDLYGIQVDTCARVMSLAGADQILMTRFAFDNARQVLKGRDLEHLGELEWLNHGQYLVDGVDGALEICEVGERGKAFLRPPAPTKHARRVAADTGVLTGWRPAVGQNVPGTQWTLQTKIADGTLGEVWLGRHAELKEQRVFKFCFDAERVRALQREVKLFRALKQHAGEHPNIVRLLEVYFDAPPYYIVTEYIQGKDLKSWWAGKNSLAHVPLSRRLEIVAQVADALQAAHDAGVIHCDVKPSNILIELDGDPADTVMAKLANFGVGRAVSREVLAGVAGDETTQTGSPLTPYSSETQLYLAPERLAGHPPTIRADLYSLGVVLYQLLVDDLRRPVSVDWERSITDDLLRDDLARCFAGNPGERFSSAAELAANLRNLETRRNAAARRQQELLHRERAAYRRGVIRTAGIAAVAVGVVATLAWLAIQGQQTARLEAGRAARAAQESQHRLERLNVAYGVRLMEQNDLLSAFQRTVNAWRIAESLGAPAEIHRIRAASLLRHSPRLLQLWSLDDDVQDVDFSPEGRRAVTAHSRTGARLWDAVTGKQLAVLVDGHRVEFAGFSPAGDRILTAAEVRHAGRWEVSLWDARTGQPAGQRWTPDAEVSYARFLHSGRGVVAATVTSEVWIWDTSTGGVLTRLRLHPGKVEHLDVSADDEVLATGGDDGIVRLTRIATGQPVVERLHVGRNLVRVAFSPDSRRLATASQDSFGRIWEVATGRLLHELPHEPGTWLTDIQFSPDGRRVLTSSWDGTARLWDAQTGQSVCHPFRHLHSVMRGRFSPDGRRVLTACFDQAARVWDVDTGELLASPLKHSGYVRLTQFDAEGRRVLSVGGDRIVRLWDLATDEPSQQTLEHATAVNAVAFSDDGQRVATASDDHTAQVWDMATRRPAGPPLVHPSEVTFVAFQPRGHLLLTLQDNGPALLWDTRAATSSQPTPLRMEGTARHAAFNADGRRVFTATTANQIAVFDPATGQPLGKPWLLDTNLTAAALSPVGDRVAVGLINGLAGVLDAVSGRRLTPWLTNASTVWSLEFSQDSRWVAAAASDDKFDPLPARVWDAASGAAVTGRLPHFDGVRDVTFSPDLKHLATASEDGTAAIWNLPSGTLAAPYLRHGYQVLRVAFNHNGRLLATASRDCTARVWETATGEPVTPPLRHANRVNAAVFSPDGAWLATAGGDGRVHFWDLRPIGLSLAECASLALLLNSRELDVESASVPAQAGQLAQTWAKLHPQFPQLFAARDPDARTWEQAQYWAARRARAWHGALEHLNRLLAARPGEWQLYWHRANTYRTLQRLPEALTDYSRVLELNPDLVQAVQSRDELLALTRTREPSGQVKEARDRSRLQEQFPENYQPQTQ